MYKSNKNLINSIVFFLWLVVSIYGILNHEIWRDEMRALSIAISTSTVMDLPVFLKNEGHPLLWYLILKFAYSIFHTTCVLPIISAMFASGICFLIVYKSPFPLLFKILVIFGFYGLYEYNIVCRNYGLSVFFLLLFAQQYIINPKNIWALSVYLILASQANIYAAMMSFIIYIWYAWVHFQTLKKNYRFYLSFLFLLASLISVIIVIYPDKSTLVVQKPITFNLLKDVWMVAYGFTDYLKLWINFNHYTFTLLLCLSIIMFMQHFKTFFALIATLLTMSFFSLCVKGNLPHHEGIYYFTFIIFAWIHYKEIEQIALKKSIRSIFIWISIAVNGFIFFNILVKGMDSYMMDIKAFKSESKAFGTWCSIHLKSNEIIISEPDFIMEGVMFYNNKPFYIPRENMINSYVHFTTQNKPNLSLSELLKKADSIGFQLNMKPILIFNRKIERIDSIYSYSYRKKFKTDTISSDCLYNKYQLIDSFDRNFLNEENYFIYKLK